MAFVLYFFVLLVAASSVLFALDWVNAPLRAPAPTERANVIKSTTQSKAQHDQRIASRMAHQEPAAATGSAPAEETPAAPPAAQTKSEPVAAPEPVVQQQAKPEPVAKPAPVAQQQPEPAAVGKPAPVAQQQPKPEPVTKPAPVTQQHPAAAAAVRTETPSADTHQEAVKKQDEARKKLDEVRKKQARRDAPRRAAGQQAARAARAEWQLRHTPRDGERATERVPSWAIRGAEAAEREAVEDARPPPRYRPFWEPQEGWHFPRPFFGGD
jgi:hypothetical protein